MDYYNHEYYSPEKFIKEAKKFAAKVEQTAVYVPFNPYWYHNLGYGNLTPPQSKWYFYWRTQLQKGNYLPTDLGYVFLHANEVLNLIGFEDHHQAYERLVNLWKHYRLIEVPVERYSWAIWDQKEYVTVRIHPIDRYLVDWIADFICVYKLQVNVLDWYTLAVAEGVLLTDIHLMVEAWLRSKKPLTDISIEALFALANYYPPRNKFYQEFCSIWHLDEIYQQGVAAIGDYVSQKHKGGKSILVRINRPYTLKRHTFDRANHIDSWKQISVVELPMQVNYKKLSAHLTSIIKYTENIFRERSNFRAKLRGFDIDDAWKHVIDSTFEIQPKPIEIDFRRVLDISRKSDAVRTRLIAETDDEVDETYSDFHPLDINSSPSAQMLNASLPKELSPKHVVVLVTLRDHAWQATEHILEAVVEGTFISVVIDQINAWAFDTFSDVLIVETDEEYVLVEDYRPEIMNLLKQIV